MKPKRTISEETYQMYCMRVHKNMSYNDISKIFGITKSACISRVSWLRRKLIKVNTPESRTNDIYTLEDKIKCLDSLEMRHGVGIEDILILREIKKDILKLRLEKRNT